MKRILYKIFMAVFLIFAYMVMSQDVKASEEISGEIEVLIASEETEMIKYKEAFEKKYPKIKVCYTTYSDYDAMVKRRFETGSYGDVLYIPSFMAEEDFWKYFEVLGSKEKLEKQYYFLENGWLYDNNVYGIPSYAYVNGLIYNKEVFAKAGISEIPKTIDEFRKAMELIKINTDAIPFYTNCAVDWTLYPWVAFPFIEMTGNDDYKYDEFIYIENPFSPGNTHYEVYRLMYDMVAQGYTESDIMNSTWYDACTMLNNGDIGCMVIGSWALEPVRNAGKHGDNIDFMPFPNQIEGTQYLSAVMDFSYGISAKSENKAAARAYLDFMLQESDYALDHENISPYKMDLYPKSLQQLEGIEIKSEVPKYDENWRFFNKLSSDMNLNNVAEIQKIMQMAESGEKSFDEIMQEWNTRWEKNRTEEIRQHENMQKNEEVVKEFDSIVNPQSMFWYKRELQFSSNEQKYINENSSIKVGYLRFYAPFSMEKDGVFQGVSYEICEDIKEYTNLQMEYIGYNTTEEMLQALENNEIDMAACVEKQDVYTHKLRYSKEYIQYVNAMVKKGEYSYEIEESSKAAIVSGEKKDYWENVNTSKHYSTLEECIDSVEQGENDYTIANFYSLNYYVSQNGNRGIFIIPSTIQESMHFVFDEQVNDTLVAIMNKCVYSISDSNIQFYVQKYMNAYESKVTLSRFVQENVFLSIGIVVLVFTVIFVLVIVVLLERNKNSRKQAVQMQRYKILSDLSDEYLFEYEYATDIVKFDPKYKEKFGIEEFVCCKDSLTTNESLVKMLEQLSDVKEKHQSTIFQIRDKAGIKEWYKMVGFSITDSNGKAIQLIGKLINAQKEMEEKISIQTKAQTDVLTSLYNREGLKQCTREMRIPVMLAVLDLDNFKQVNDKLGHAGGDEALKLLAKKMKECIGKEAILARYGGDEFVIVQSMVSEEKAKEGLQALVNAMDTEMVYEGMKKKLSISVGSIYCLKENVTIDELFKEADKELYKTKQNGKNGYSMRYLNI